MYIKKLEIRGGRIWLNREQLAHFIWNHYNPDDPWRKGFVVHHKDGNSLNDYVENLEKMTLSKHSKLHNSGNKSHWFGGAPIGEKNPFYGKHHTEEVKNRMSLAKKGKPLSKEHCKKLSEVNKGKFKGEKNPRYGKSPWNKGLKRPKNISQKEWYEGLK